MDSVLNNGMSWGERLKDGGQMILIVMAFVFSVIFLIWLSQTIISLVVVALTSAASRKAEKKAPKPEPAAVSEVPQSIPAEPAVEDDSVTVAVITAAIAAYLASESPNGNVVPFRVVSFKRSNQGKPWNSNV